MTEPLPLPPDGTGHETAAPAPPPQASGRARRDPPSVRLVLGALRESGRLTGAQLRQRSGLPRRTVYQALRLLRERGAVRHRKSLQDTRQSYFWLADGPDEPAAVDRHLADALRFGAETPARAAVPASDGFAGLT
jgi:DNA-binding transcriptional ArsR family regulator